MTPSFSDITYFIEVANTKNVSRAAERLGISQPSLSTAMKRLEDALGAQLLLRSKTGVQLTKAGIQFLARSKDLLANWENLKAEVQKRHDEVSGSYSIGCHQSVALYSLHLFLPQLLQKHPDLNIQLEHDLSRKITEYVISFEIDFGLAVNPVRHPDLVIKELCTDTVGFWIAKRPSPNQDLKSENSILVCDSNLIQVQKLISDLNKKGIQFRRVINSSNLEVITEMTRSGVGIGILPARVATQSGHNEVKLLDKKLPVFKDKICLVYRKDMQNSVASKTIIASISKGFLVK